MRTLRKLILTAWKIFFIGWLIFELEQICEKFSNTPWDHSFLGWIGHVVSPIAVILLAIPTLIYYHLHLPVDIYSVGIISIVALSVNFLMKRFEKPETTVLTNRNTTQNNSGSSYSSDYSSSSINYPSSNHSINIHDNVSENNEFKNENRVIGHAGSGNKINQQTGVIQ